MKKFVFIVAVLSSLTLFGQKRDSIAFFTYDVAPQLENILPSPPGLDDPLFFNDWNQYLWGKSVRGTERGELAVADARINSVYFLKRFSPAVGRTLTPEEYPILNQLLLRAHHTEQQAGRSAKKHFARVRPYQQFHEASGMPEWENQKDFTSYPSGHTHASWLEGMILTAIDPEHAEQIMKVAYELGQSRVILGYHYQSDVDAGRIAASITFARLCSMPEFLEMLQKAKDEYNGKK